MSDQSQDQPQETAEAEQTLADQVVQYMVGSDPSPDTDHSTCHPESPCRSGSVGIKAVIVDGETFLSRDDVLGIIGRAHVAYQAREEHAKTHIAENPAFMQQALLYGMGAAATNLLGQQIYSITQPGRAVSLEVPDTIPTDWLGDSAPKAPESAIEAAIRTAKEQVERAKSEQSGEQESGQ